MLSDVYSRLSELYRIRLSIKHNGDWIRAVAMIKGSILKLMKIMHVIKILHGLYSDLKNRKQIKRRVNTLYVFKYCRRNRATDRAYISMYI